VPAAGVPGRAVGVIFNGVVEFKTPLAEVRVKSEVPPLAKVTAAAPVIFVPRLVKL
jgi:hypothetical protein